MARRCSPFASVCGICVVQNVRGLAHHRRPIPLTAAVRRAREAWAIGDYETTLLSLDEADDHESFGELRDEAILLRARALYRLLRYADLISVLAPVTTTFGSADATATARMLLGTALARSGRLDDALAELESAADAAEAVGVHRAIRAELAHARGLAYWLGGDCDSALRFALAAERARADVISVRAAQLRGFVAVSQQKYPEALSLFRSALDRYRTCRERDDALVEQTLFQVSSLELTLRSAREPGTHRVQEARRVRPWEPSAPCASSAMRVQSAVFDGWLYAHDGDSVNALRLMREADESAPTVAWTVWVLAQRAGVALGFGERANAHDFAAQALAFARAVEWDATQGEERVGLLLLAEVLATLAPATSTALIARYDALPPLSRNQVLAVDPRLRALELHVRGVVAKGTNEGMKARVLLKDAAREWRTIGNLWRTALALIELDATVSSGAASVLAERTQPIGFYIEAAALIVREHFPRSFLGRRIGGWLTAYGDPIAAALAPHKRQVLRFVLAGFDNKQIAAQLGLRYNSVRSYLAEIHSAFGTHSDRELFAECMRRGIADPSALTTAPDSRAG